MIPSLTDDVLMPPEIRDMLKGKQEEDPVELSRVEVNELFNQNINRKTI